MTGGRIIVLGRTGRNFAAGMNGGIAYVFDLDGSFALNCNIDMVDFEMLDNPSERARVRDLIARHVALTGSVVGERILKGWPSLHRHFVVVVPREFKRIRDAAAGTGAESSHLVA
jgi:glutamate synthase domain-containing protein 3